MVELPGDPRGKGRPRFRYVKPKDASRPGFVSVYTDAETVAYETALKWKGKAAMRGRPPLEGPLAVRVFAMMPIPKSWPNKRRDAALAGMVFPTGKPDADNILKMLDALNTKADRSGEPGFRGVWLDDAQIVRSLVVKEYGEHPGLIVEVYQLP